MLGQGAEVFRPDFYSDEDWRDEQVETETLTSAEAERIIALTRSVVGGTVPDSDSFAELIPLDEPSVELAREELRRIVGALRGDEARALHSVWLGSAATR